MKNRFLEGSVVAVVMLLLGIMVGERLQLRAMSNVSRDQIDVLARYFTGFVIPDLGLYNGGQSEVGSEGWLTQYGTGRDVKIMDVLGGDYVIEFEKKYWFFVDKDRPIVVVKVIPALICLKNPKANWLESDAIEVRYSLADSLSYLRKQLANGEDALENIVAFQVRDSWKKDSRVMKLKKDILNHFEKITRKYDTPTLSHPIAEACK